MATEKPSVLAMVILVVIVLIVAGIGAILLYEYNKPKSAPTILRIQEGDNATVNYIGEFGSGAQEGRVFDTSFYAVAVNNLSFPKSLEYTPRGPVTAYSPLGVHVGPTAPASGYTIGNLTFNTVVTGFWKGLLGLAGNQSRTIVVPPNVGYGALNTSCVETSPLVFTVPELTNVPAAKFGALYPAGTATIGAVFADPTYGWNDTVLSVNATTVVVESLAILGTLAHPQGLPFVVSALNATTITLESTLSPSDAGQVLGHVTSGGLCGKTEFIVSAVDLGAGTLTENFNPEVQGETLDFVVTVVDIFSA
jgi:FKBP-type peptidyl-prolyl cis-trans isomerase 2